MTARRWAGRGLGAGLLRSAELRIRAGGRRFSGLDRAQDNAALVAWYRAKGYTPCGTCESPHGLSPVVLLEKRVDDSFYP